MNWFRFFDALLRGERWAVRGMAAWVAVVILLFTGLIIYEW